MQTIHDYLSWASPVLKDKMLAARERFGQPCIKAMQDRCGMDYSLAISQGRCAIHKTVGRKTTRCTDWVPLLQKDALCEAFQP